LTLITWKLQDEILQAGLGFERRYRFLQTGEKCNLDAYPKKFGPFHCRKAKAARPLCFQRQENPIEEAANLWH